MEKKESGIVLREQGKTEVGSINPTNKTEGLSPLVMLAMNPEIDIEKIDKLIDVQTKFEEAEAKKEYNIAFSKFKQTAPVISKDGEVDFTFKGNRTNYKHTTLGNLMSIVTPLLAAQGLALYWLLNQKENSIEVTAVLTHVLGHSSKTRLIAPPDNSGGKNSIQAVNSTVTYLERYTGFAILGLASGKDDDGQTSQPEQQQKPVYETEVEATAKLMEVQTLQGLEEICHRYKTDYQNKITGWSPEEWKRLVAQMSVAKGNFKEDSKPAEETKTCGF